MQETDVKRHRFNPWIGKIPRRRAWEPPPVFLPREAMDKGAWQVQSIGLQRIRHDWNVWASMHARVISSSLQLTDGGTPSFPVLHYLLEYAQTHIHSVGDDAGNSLCLGTYNSHQLLRFPLKYHGKLYFLSNVWEKRNGDVKWCSCSRPLVTAIKMSGSIRSGLCIISKQTKENCAYCVVFLYWSEFCTHWDFPSM